MAATKKKKYPKRPKKSSSIVVWENYEQKCKDVDKHNKDIEDGKKKKAAIISRISKKTRK